MPKIYDIIHPLRISPLEATQPKQNAFPALRQRRAEQKQKRYINRRTAISFAKVIQGIPLVTLSRIVLHRNPQFVCQLKTLRQELVDCSLAFRQIAPYNEFAVNSQVVNRVELRIEKY